MKICFIGVESQFQEDCRAQLRELIPDNCDLIASLAEPVLPEADVYLWDVCDEMFSLSLTPEMVKRSLFVIDPCLLERFRGLLGAMRASILLKPVRPAALRPFLEHAVRQCSPVAVEPNAASAGGEEVGDLLDRLLQTNLKLQEYDQFRTNFLARAVHDFRAPLTSLGGYCGLLVDQRLGSLNASQVDLLSKMRRSVMRLSHLADAMFDLSLGRKVKKDLNLQKGDIAATIGQAIHEMRPYAAGKNIRVTVRLDAPHQPLLFDAGRIERLLINLLDNACKFTPKNGTIHVSGYPLSRNRRSAHPFGASASSGDGAQRTLVPNAYRIDVRDSGSGIPGEHLESIFEEFTSYSGGTDRSGGGLGLAICRMIVNDHRGSIWAESGPAGTRFSVILPQAEAKNPRLGMGKVASVVAAKSLSV